MVEKRDVRRKGWQAVDTTVKELKYTVTPLNDGSLYVFRVAAENAVGLGPFCELQDSVLAKDTFSKRVVMYICIISIRRMKKSSLFALLMQDNKIYFCYSYSWATVRAHCRCGEQEICGSVVGGT